MSDVLRIGVYGCRRGNAYINAFYGGKIPGARITALCDKNEERLRDAAGCCSSEAEAPKLFRDAEEFFDSGLFDAVILSNYFNEHAQYAIKALKKNIHVFSENMAAATLSLAVELCRTAEKSKAIYMMAENYPFFAGVMEMKRLYDGGTLGKLRFAEGEYVHPMSLASANSLHDTNVNGQYHWRRFNPVTYYSSHSLAPLMYITGEMPKRVVAMAAQDTEEHNIEYNRMKSEAVGVMLVNTDGGSVFRVNGTSGMGPGGNWYRIACQKGGAETVRGQQGKVRLSYNEWSTPEGAETERIYDAEYPADGSELAAGAGHGGSDYWVLRYFIEACRGERAPWPDVYSACAMSATAILGWRSILNGNIAYDIPDFRKEEERAKFEEDRAWPWPTETTPNNIPFTTQKTTPYKEFLAKSENGNKGE